MGGASGAVAGALLNLREGTIGGMRVSRTTAKDNEVEVEVIEGRDKSQGCEGTGDVEEVAQVIQYNQSCGNYSDSSTTEREVSARHRRKMPSTKRLCRLRTRWRRSTRPSK